MSCTIILHSNLDNMVPTIPVSQSMSWLPGCGCLEGSTHIRQDVSTLYLIDKHNHRFIPYNLKPIKSFRSPHLQDCRHHPASDRRLGGAQHPKVNHAAGRRTAAAGGPHPRRFIFADRDIPGCRARVWPRRRHTGGQNSACLQQGSTFCGCTCLLQPQQIIQDAWTNRWPSGNT